MQYGVALVDTIRERRVFCLKIKNTSVVHLYRRWVTGYNAMTYNKFFVREHFSNFVV